MGNIFFYTIVLSAFAFILNLPFGYLRTTSIKFSFKWFLYIHLPIPFIIALRWELGVDYKAVPLIIIGAIAGQFFGGRLKRAV